MNDNTYTMRERRPLALDGVQPRQTITSQPGAPTSSDATRPPMRRTYAKPRPATAPSRGVWQKLQLPLLLLGAAIAGFVVDNLLLGLSLLALYAIAAFVTHISSRVTFTLALLLLIAISILLLFKPNMQLIRTFATYTFVLVTVGVITLGKEARLPKRTRRKYRR